MAVYDEATALSAIPPPAHRPCTFPGRSAARSPCGVVHCRPGIVPGSESGLSRVSRGHDVERSRISGAPLRKGYALHRVREKHQGLVRHQRLCQPMRPQRKAPAAPAQGVTLWRRIAHDLEQAIALGTHAAGGRLPGEVEIAARFGVNRHTVRRALAELTARGLVRAERGSGTYVERSRLAYPIGARTRFSEIVGSAGRDPGGRLIGHGSESAAPDIARQLGLEVGDAGVRLEILRSADRVPICSTTSWLPAARAANAARVFRASRSITATL